MRGDVETYHESGRWHVKIEGDASPKSSHGTKDEAVREGRKLAMIRKVEHIIRNMDGTIAERNSYGNDPRNIPG